MDFDTILGRYVGKNNVDKVKKAAAPVVEAGKYVLDPVLDASSNILNPISRRIKGEDLIDKRDDLDTAQEISSGLLNDLMVEGVMKGAGGVAKAGAKAVAPYVTMPEALKTPLAVLAGASAILSKVPKGPAGINKEIQKELKYSVGKGAVAAVNHYDESGNKDDSKDVGANTTAYELMGDTIGDIIGFGNRKGDAIAEFTVKTILDAAFNDLENKYEDGIKDRRKHLKERSY